jgi:hypothetical protein
VLPRSTEHESEELVRKVDELHAQLPMLDDLGTANGRAPYGNRGIAGTAVQANDWAMFTAIIAVLAPLVVGITFTPYPWYLTPNPRGRC